MTDVIVAGSNNITGHGIIAALAGSSYTLLGYDYSDSSTNPASRHCRHVQVPAATDPGYVSAVAGLLKEHCPRVIVPSNDSDLRALLAMKAADHPDFRCTVLNGFGPNTLDLLDKEATTALFQAHGIPTPDLVNPDSPLPIVARMKQVGRGRKSSRVITEGAPTEEELRTCTFTKFIDGPEYTVDVLSDHRARPIAVVPRLRREVRYGMVHLGEVVKDDLVIEATTRLAQELKLTGINCVQCIRTPDQAYFFEVNSRPGSGMSLTTAAGVNMPALLMRLYAYDDVGRPEPEWGLKMARYFEGYYFK